MKQVFLIYKIIIIVALVIHFAIKDTFYWSSLVFYAFPLPIIIGLLIISLIFTKKKLRRNTIIISTLLGIVWFTQSYIRNEITNDNKGLEIVFWNASHNRNFEDAFIENNRIPDILVLVESNMQSLNNIELKYPNYHFHLSKEGIGVFSKSLLKIGEEKTSEDNTTILDFETNNYNFVVVDVSPSILNFRKKSLQFVNSGIIKKDKTIVLGDFNTPFESLHFKNFKENYQNAFIKKGNGFRETWFWNIPLLMLDHIWVSKDLEINKVDKICTLKSDHTLLRMFLNK